MNSFKICVLFFSLGLFSSCGNTCNPINRIFAEPSCKNLNLKASKSVSLLSASCLTPNARKVSASCPPGTGTSAQCTSVSNTFPIEVVLVANNAAGSFLDGTGVTYSNCNNLFTALNAVPPNVQDVSALYISNNLSPGDTLTCTDGGGCVLPPSTSCFSGWDPVARAPSGSANLPMGGNYLTCVFIDNSSLPAPVPAPASVRNWFTPMFPVTIGGTVSFGVGAGWVDAY